MEHELRRARSKASREASEWFVFLQDDPADGPLRRRFESWLNADPAHRDAWAETVQTSSLAESLLPFDARDWKQDRVRPTRRRWLLPAVAGTAVAALAVLLAPAAILRLQSDYRTGTAQMLDVPLQDGSIVTLAPGSAVSVSLTPEERRVRLLSGQAYFSVTPDPARPFRVTANSVQASVLGTSFDVQLEHDGAAVAVTEGRVQVRAHDVDEVLGAGQRLRVAPGLPAERGSKATMAIGAWRHGQLIMEDEPFGVAIASLDRYFDGSIVLVDGALGSRMITGIFDLRDPEAALRTMASALGATVRKVSPWLLVVSGS